LAIEVTVGQLARDAQVVDQQAHSTTNECSR